MGRIFGSKSTRPTKRRPLRKPRSVTYTRGRPKWKVKRKA